MKDIPKCICHILSLVVSQNITLLINLEWRHKAIIYTTKYIQDLLKTNDFCALPYDPVFWLLFE